MTTQVTVSDIPNNVIINETGVQVVAVSAPGPMGAVGGFTLTNYSYGTSATTLTNGQLFDDGHTITVIRYDSTGMGQTVSLNQIVPGSAVKIFTTDGKKYKYYLTTTYQISPPPGCYTYGY